VSDPNEMVAFSLLHNPRNASNTTDPRVMAGAIEARGKSTKVLSKGS
jgi:hypothetical protein